MNRRYSVPYPLSKTRTYVLIIIFFMLILGSMAIAGYLVREPKKIQTDLGAVSGDCNTDGKVDIIDFQLLSNSFGKAQGQTGYYAGCDFNGDNTINILDFQTLSNNFGRAVTLTITPTLRLTQTVTPRPSGPTPTILPPPPGDGIWISQTDIMTRPTSGSAWQSLLSAASGSWGTADLSNQDSKHDQMVLAGALVCARTNQYCDKTLQGLTSAIGTENGARWLAIGRNLLGYTIAADVTKNSGHLTGTDLNKFSAWLASFLTRTLRSNNSTDQEVLTPFQSGSNASAQEGAVYAAIARYTNNSNKLNYVWNRFRLYSCDRTNNPETVINVQAGFDAGWSFASNITDACAVNPKGSVKQGINIDGVVINDMRRGGNFQWPPVYTFYEWTGLEGYIPAAMVLYRAGLPSFQIKDQAVLRAASYTCYLKNNTSEPRWWDPSDHAGVKHLLKTVYNYSPSGCGINYPTGSGMIIGYTDWTHPAGN